MKLRVIGLELRPLLVHKSIEPEAVAVAFGVGEVGQDLGDGEAIGGRYPPRILLGEFTHQPAQNLRRGFQLPDGRESVVCHLSILLCSPRPRHAVAGNADVAWCNNVRSAIRTDMTGLNILTYTIPTFTI